MSILMLIAIILPIVFGLLLFIEKIKNIKKIQLISIIFLTILSLFVYVILICVDEDLVLLKFTEKLELSFRCDGFSKIFAGMVAILWPVAVIYSFTYLKEDSRKFSYFAFYIMTYGVVLGIAFAANAITMYLFYEVLTFITLPLIIHTETKEARKAGRHYLYYSLSGSTLSLAGIIMLTIISGSTDFSVSSIDGSGSLIQLAYLFTFFGFGVKCAIFPLNGWLPKASSAPTPTTALLHAVAVVKAGAFAIFRMTYSIFDSKTLVGTTAQYIALIFIAITIIYGSFMAVKEQHFKRRFAYSTIANLSYILFGALLCTKLGLLASIMHFIVHSITKICLFFCVGAIIENTKAQYVWQLNGLGKKMPIIFSIFTIAGLCLVGVPMLAGFVSKYYLISASFESVSIPAMIGMGTIILSAICTSYYALSITIRAFTRKPTQDSALIFEKAKEPSIGFILPSLFFAILCIVVGICASPIVNLISNLIGGII